SIHHAYFQAGADITTTNTFTATRIGQADYGLEEAVRGAMLVGKGPETIRKVVAVADDLKTAPGMCGSLSGMIPVEVGQPHVLVSELVVGGQA
ncbi:MAG: hypothetical protein C4303_07630, partial [candidate division GAL15 bacterium]